MYLIYNYSTIYQRYSKLNRRKWRVRIILQLVVQFSEETIFSLCINSQITFRQGQEIELL